MLTEKLIPQKNLEHLENLLSYFIIQREAAKPVPELQQTLKDIRTYIFGIISNYYVPLPSNLEQDFLDEIKDYFSELRLENYEEIVDQTYFDYCLDEIIASFKQSPEIKAGIRSGQTNSMSRFLSTQILNPFNLNLRPFFKIVKSDVNRT